MVMKFLNEKIQKYSEKEDILAKSLLIAQKKKENPSIINATLGVLKDENGTLAVLESVNDIIKNLPNEQFYAYNDTIGPSLFEETLLKYLFRSYREEILQHKATKVLPTPGATGALNLSLFLGCNPNDEVILPYLCWGVYENMCHSLNLKVHWYDYIVNQKYDLQGFKQATQEVKKKQNHIVTILNDPCNNPTGYSLSEQELEDLLLFIKEEKDTQFTLIYDIAYFEYGKEDGRRKFQILEKAPVNCLIIIAFSASKAFTLYGLRMGAMIILHEQKSIVDDYFKIAKSMARTRWSCVCTPSLHALIQLIQNEDCRHQFERQLNDLRNMLIERADLFTLEAKKNQLPMIPYHGGFFVSVYTHDAQGLTNRLAQKEVYVLPFQKVIRIGICSMSLKEIPQIVRKVKECL